MDVGNVFFARHGELRTNITVAVSSQKQPLTTATPATAAKQLDSGNIPPRSKRNPCSDVEDLVLIAIVKRCGEVTEVGVDQVLSFQWICQIFMVAHSMKMECTWQLLRQESCCSSGPWAIGTINSTWLQKAFGEPSSHCSHVCKVYRSIMNRLLDRQSCDDETMPLDETLCSSLEVGVPLTVGFLGFAYKNGQRFLSYGAKNHYYGGKNMINSQEPLLAPRKAPLVAPRHKGTEEAYVTYQYINGGTHMSPKTSGV
ncbi:hypothetical protein ACET3Z_023547 [Daucus carota]